MAYSGRPNRSDVHLPAEEEARLETKTREYFDETAPKRHTKPQRSEYSSKYVDAISSNNKNNNDDVIPELVEFQRLENDPQKLVYNGREATEEFVETEYYKDLNDVDKQHHTTGTGFIKVEKTDGKGFNLAPDSDTSYHGSCQSNPATNEWIPTFDNMVTHASDKPNRSDNN
ncbi:hypothetical protein F2P56_032397 [Juglans regia]|uniref:Uncharacterized protein LOC109002246 n=2 Tax=Juglans regia TaxID=51240 RepID=A0A2I4FUY1_JUGRE|nr:uncharacterized protein LOC109002246 [Juglans regia]KAF5446796.1 hypothetical protein F2P56_032397 [Juglans regia]